MQDPILKSFDKAIADQLTEHQQFVLTGKCSTMEDYRRRIGIIAGIMTSREILADTLKRDDDED